MRRTKRNRLQKMKAPWLPNDYARCKGVSHREDEKTFWREGCEACLRRTAPRQGIGPVISPPAIIAFECPDLISPDEKTP